MFDVFHWRVRLTREIAYAKRAEECRRLAKVCPEHLSEAISNWRPNMSSLRRKRRSRLLWSRLEPAIPVPDPHAVPFEVNGRKVLVWRTRTCSTCFPGPPAFIRIVDVTMEERPVPIATFQIDALDGTPQPRATACHQPVEKITGSEVPVAWFAPGMRVIDIGRPQAPREVAYFVPDPRARCPSGRRATTCSWTSAG